MSHILDALRRAEDERRLGKPPDRGMIAGPLRGRSSTPRNKGWLIVIGFLVLGGTGAAAYALYARHAADTEDAVVATQPSPASVSAADPEPEALAETPGPQTAPAPAAPDALQEDPERPERAPLPRAQLADAERIEDMDALFDTETPPRPMPSTPEAPATSLQPRDVMAGDTGTPEPKPRAESGAETSELPDARTAGMPDFTIQVHAWAPEAEQRFIRVDGRRLSEGDRLPNDARIERITRDGMVLEWRDQRVLRRLGR